MTVRFKMPLRIVNDYDIRQLEFQGHTVKPLRLDEVTAHVELTARGQPRRLLEFQWEAGLKCATLVGTNFQGSLLFLDLGPARGKGARLLERLVDLNAVPDAPRLRVRRTGRPLSPWAQQVALLKRDSVAQKEGKGKP